MPRRRAARPPTPERAAGPATGVTATATIAAIATPPGFGGVGIVRCSGPAVPALVRGLLGRSLRPRLATFATFHGEQGPIDHGLALYFKAPASFTGEDVLELQGHGGPVVLDLLLARCLALGARPARPGEFSERAFHHGKLDLAQAEAVADLIASRSVAAARAAQASLTGEFSRRVQALSAQLMALRVQLEAALDFADEDITPADAQGQWRALQALRESLAALQRSAAHGARLQQGLTVLIAGPPNAGKSSLLNRLAGSESAIVTPIAGTTRDVLREQLLLDGLPLEVLDTAGLRESRDPIEQEGMRRARAAASRADVILWVTEAGAPVPPDPALETSEAALLVLHNKIDLAVPPPMPAPPDESAPLRCSMRTGEGIEALRQRLRQVAGVEGNPERGAFSARRRHLHALAAAQHALAVLTPAEFTGAPELAAEQLRLAHHELGTITGEVTTEDLLGKIFASFCIGK